MTDPDTVTKLQELTAAIRGYDDPRRAAGEWKQVYKLLQGTALPPGRAAHVVGMRDVEALAALVGQLQAPAAAAEAAPTDAPDAETCRRALRAFRKRLALARLDDESRLGHSPLTKGQDSQINALMPPPEWPESVWRELVRQGRLRYVGHGLYALTKQADG